MSPEKSESERRIAKYKEERRRQLASHIASRIPAQSSSSDEDGIRNKSYAKYRRRKKKKRVTLNEPEQLNTNVLPKRESPSKNDNLIRNFDDDAILFNNNNFQSKPKIRSNTSYSSEEMLLQAVNSLQGLEEEFKTATNRSSSTSSSPRMAASDVTGGKNLRKKPPKRSISGDAERLPILDPSSPSSYSKPPIFPPSSPPPKANLRKDSSRRRSTEGIVSYEKELRRRSALDRQRSSSPPPRTTPPPQKRPQSAVVHFPSKEDEEVEFDEERVLKTCQDFIRAYDTERKSQFSVDEQSSNNFHSAIIRTRSSSLTIHDKKLPTVSSDEIYLKPILKKSSEDIIKDLNGGNSSNGLGILKRRQEHVHIQIPPKNTLLNETKPFSTPATSSEEESRFTHSILKRTPEDEDLLENVHGILKRRSSSVGISSPDGTLDSDGFRTPSSILKKQGSLEDLDIVKSILKKTTDDEEEPYSGHSSQTPRSILKSRRSEDSLSPDEDLDDHIRPILKRKESKEENITTEFRSIKSHSLDYNETENSSLTIRQRPSSTSPNSPSRFDVSTFSVALSKQSSRLGSKEAENGVEFQKKTPALSKRSSSLKSVIGEDLKLEFLRNENYEKGDYSYHNHKQNGVPLEILPPISRSFKRDSSNKAKNKRRFQTQPITVDEVQKAAKLRNQIYISGGALSFGGAVILGSSDPNKISPSAESLCGLNNKKEEPSSILKRKGSLRRETSSERNTISDIPSSSSASHCSSPRKSILKHDSGDPPEISGILSGDENFRKLKGVLKKDSSYEDTLRPILKNLNDDDSEERREIGVGGDDSSASSGIVAKTFSDVIIDPIPNGRQSPYSGSSELSDEEITPRNQSKQSVIPPSSVRISADGDLALKLDRLALQANAIRRVQDQNNKFNENLRKHSKDEDDFFSSITNNLVQDTSSIRK